MVVLSHRSFTFENLNGDSFLVVLISGEGLALLSWDNSGSGDNLSHDSTNSFNTKGQRSSVNKENLLASLSFIGTTKDTTLNSSTIGDGFIGVNTSVWLFTVEEVLDQFLDLGDTGGTTNQNDLINFVLLEASFIKSVLNGGEGFLEKISVDFFEFSSGEDLREFFTIQKIFDFNLDFVNI
mmetsp:Transcript_20089/g.17214  ORF Transcript_20089/g.17214 Transcript_20089/m.17214 type:complete len:181 (-) Transcript_20089:931-1473(-)